MILEIVLESCKLYLTQIFQKKPLEIAEKLRNEYVIEVTGKVIERAENQKNPNMNTGAIEVQVSEVTIINEAKNPPFAIENETDVG